MTSDPYVTKSTEIQDPRRRAACLYSHTYSVAILTEHPSTWSTGRDLRSKEIFGLKRSLVSRDIWSTEISGLQRSLVYRNIWSTEISGLQWTVLLIYVALFKDYSNSVYS